MYWDGTLFLSGQGHSFVCGSLVSTVYVALDVTARAWPWEAGGSVWVRRLSISAFGVVYIVFLKLLAGVSYSLLWSVIPQKATLGS